MFKIAKFVNTKFSALIKLLKNRIPYTTYEEVNTILHYYLEKHIENKFFAWIHYMDAHIPYHPPKNFWKISISRLEIYKLNTKLMKSVKKPILKRDEIEKLKELYRAQIKHVDYAVGSLIEKLKETVYLKKVS